MHTEALYCEAQEKDKHSQYLCRGARIDGQRKLLLSQAYSRCFTFSIRCTLGLLLALYHVPQLYSNTSGFAGQRSPIGQLIA